MAWAGTRRFGPDRKLSFPSDVCAQSDVARRLVLRPKTNLDRLLFGGRAFPVRLPGILRTVRHLGAAGTRNVGQFIQMEGPRDVSERRGPVYLEPVRRHLGATGFRFAKEGHAAAARVSDFNGFLPHVGSAPYIDAWPCNA